GSIHLRDCHVSDADILGSVGGGFSVFQHSLELERCFIMATQIGRMRRQLEETIQFAKTREQFGQPIGKFQSVSHRIAEMQLRLETSQLLLYKLAWLKSQGQSAMRQAALLKLHLSESFLENSMDAIRIHGGRGYLADHDSQRDLRDALGGVMYGGTSDVQRNLIAGLAGV
ncbi:MAG: acyl-CoA dehydrogenase, partial [Planctomycetota bacterium]